MKIRKLLLSVIKEINTTNLNKVMDTFSKSMIDFSESMDKITQDLAPVEKSKSHSMQNDKNVEKLLGKRKPIW
jgi:hypothetical protein